jgi:TolA-binding protein
MSWVPSYKNIILGLVGAIALTSCVTSPPQPPVETKTVVAPPLVSTDNTDVVNALQKQLRDREQRIKELTAQVEAASAQSMQKQLRERDQRIKELTAQLETLKMIDQDRGTRKKSSLRPTTLTPIK